MTRWFSIRDALSARAAAAALRDVLVPPRCVGCGAPGAWFCTGCRDLCDPVELRQGPLVVRAAGGHAGPLRDAIHRMKYRNEPGLARDLGALVAGLLAADLANGVRVDTVVPVSLHPSRVFDRGYDQARLLAECIADSVQLPLHVAVHRIRAGVPQRTLDRPARAANVRGAYVAEAGALRGRHVALIDDVATTGATLGAAAEAARAAGARAVRGYTVAAEE